MYDFDLSDYILIMPERPFKKSFRKINFEGTQINYLLTNLFEKVGVLVPLFLFVQNALCAWNIFYRKVEPE